VAEPKVSVAIITYNQRHFLEECLDSVVAQDYPNFEIVVADDGSTDGSQALLAEYAERHPGRFVLRLGSSNRGITANANEAHFACSGDYIAWFGGDDVMLPGKLRRQVEIMEANPDVALCYHDLDAFLSETGERLYLFSQKSRPREGGVRAAIRYGTFNGGSATMVRRSATPPQGHDPRIVNASDWLYWVETVAPAGRIVYIDEVLARYRRHSRNVTSSSSFVRSLIEDHILSGVILLKAMPQYAPETFATTARNLVSLARRTHGPGRWPLALGGAALYGAFLVAMPFVAVARVVAGDRRAGGSR
jgi:glycosyltransferase involved in cell wall biosynthesis